VPLAGLVENFSPMPRMRRPLGSDKAGRSPAAFPWFPRALLASVAPGRLSRGGLPSIPSARPSPFPLGPPAPQSTMGEIAEQDRDAFLRTVAMITHPPSE